MPIITQYMPDGARAQFERTIEEQHDAIERLGRVYEDYETLDDILADMAEAVEEFTAKAEELIERWRKC